MGTTNRKWIIKDEESAWELLSDLCLDVAGARPGFLFVALLAAILLFVKVLA